MVIKSLLKPILKVPTVHVLDQNMVVVLIKLPKNGIQMDLTVQIVTQPSVVVMIINMVK